MSGDVDAPFGSFGPFGIKDVDPHMFINKQSVTGGQHENGGVQVKDTLLHRDGIDAEHIAANHDAELDQDHGYDEPFQPLGN